ncbi:hypothetical protein ANCCAN_01365 [Ancylostoma caninum]|uniref:Uncharacterized protein n=1 Tax=Ancylostoma caninum TaxID=29170 RepID=A0A368H6S4_ANCCA|nr:hypothetical protein ANCCAN_01365 [Ancylostoma caninum]
MFQEFGAAPELFRLTSLLTEFQCLRAVATRRRGLADKSHSAVDHAIFAGPPDLAEIKKRLKEKPFKPTTYEEGDDPWSYTRLLTVDYAFETETVMYDMLKNKVKAPSTIIAGNFSFDTLHHDLEGGMLSKFKVNKFFFRMFFFQHFQINSMEEGTA